MSINIEEAKSTHLATAKLSLISTESCKIFVFFIFNILKYMPLFIKTFSEIIIGFIYLSIVFVS